MRPARFGASDGQVRPVTSRSDWRHFRRLPRQLRACEPAWVEPLRVVQNSLLDRRRHPFYEAGRGAEAEFFLARGADGRPLGRIAAIVNHRHAAHARRCGSEDQQAGFFGFFDCVDSPQVSQRLIAAAAHWLRERGLTQMLGPASPSQTYEYGLLVEGHERPHRFLLDHQPRYYAPLLESSGLQKAKDLLGMSLDLRAPGVQEFLDRFFAFADTAEGRAPGDITIRSPEIRRFEAEVRTACGLFNQVLGGLWGHCPLTEGELGEIAWSLRRFAMPDTLLIAEQSGVPVGLALTVPDLNELIPRLRLRMSLLEPLELLLRARRWRPACARILVLGVIAGYERSLVVPAVVARLGRGLLAHGIRFVDAHLVLEDNASILVPLRRYGFRTDRRYRIYCLDL